LKGPGGIDGAAVFPENTVKIGFFLQGKALRSFSLPPGPGDPAATGTHKISIFHLTFRRQPYDIPFGKKHITAFMPAAGRTTGTGKLKPGGIKNLFSVLHNPLYYNISGKLYKIKSG
jgi:hypothetical protein